MPLLLSLGFYYLEVVLFLPSDLSPVRSFRWIYLSIDNCPGKVGVELSATPGTDAVAASSTPPSFIIHQLLSLLYVHTYMGD